MEAWIDGSPPANVWLGTTVEDRKSLARLDRLRAVPAAVHFVSFEPLLEDLGAVDLRDIEWAIVGGESGGNARPFDLDWARSLRDQCAAAGTAWFMKQLGDRPFDSARLFGVHAPHDKRTPQKSDGAGGMMDAGNLVLKKAHHGADPAEWPDDLRLQNFPRAA